MCSSDLSIGQTIANTSKDHLKPQKGQDHPWDMSELLFGTVSETAGRSLKGRVSVGLFRAQKQPQLGGVIKTILNSPKPSYYPFYIEQNIDDKQNRNWQQNPARQGDVVSAQGDGGYRTYSTAAAKEINNQTPAQANLPEVRGWKRYLPRGAANPIPPNNDQEAVSTKFQPIQANTGHFKGVIQFHNLRAAELGALFMALKLSTPEDSLVGAHLLGMAKPYGYGRIKLSITGLELYPNDPKHKEGALYDEDSYPKIKGFIEAFKQTIDREKTDWANATGSRHKLPYDASEQIKALNILNTAQTAASLLPEGNASPYLSLNPDKKINQFIDVKGNKRSSLPSLALARPVIKGQDRKTTAMAATPPVSVPPAYLTGN